MRTSHWVVGLIAWMTAAGIGTPAVAQTRPVAAGAGRTAEAKPAAGDPAPGGEVARDRIVGVMRFVPPTGPSGFRQGSPEGEACRYTDEAPFFHAISGALAVMETEVTRGMWAELAAIAGTDLPPDPSDAARTVPVDARNYATAPCHCDFKGEGYRLPTEGEWEYFARAGTSTPFSMPEPRYPGPACYGCKGEGMAGLDAAAWFCANSGGVTHPVGEKARNPWNLADIHGNVREFCWDWQADYPSGPVRDYRGPAAGTYRVTRGGGVMAYPRGCRSANRYGGAESARAWGIGFRLVRSLPPSAAAEKAGQGGDKTR